MDDPSMTEGGCARTDGHRSEIARILATLKDKYAHEVRPTSISELASANPELVANMKEVRRYVAQMKCGTVAKYFSDEGIISKCATDGSIPRSLVRTQYRPPEKTSSEAI